MVEERVPTLEEVRDWAASGWLAHREHPQFGFADSKAFDLWLAAYTARVLETELTIERVSEHQFFESEEECGCICGVSLEWKEWPQHFRNAITTDIAEDA